MNKKATIQMGLPALPFGENHANTHHSVQTMADELSGVFDWLVEYDVIRKEQPFTHRACEITINNLNLIATASSPVHVKVKDSPAATILIPFHGRHLSVLDGKKLWWQAGKTAVLMPACSRGGEACTRSALMFDIDPQRLAMTASSMLATSPDNIPDFALDDARTIALQAGRVDFSVIYQTVCSLIDSYLPNHHLLDSSGIDDNIYRNLVLMLRPDQFLEPAKHRPVKFDRRLDRLCQFIQANLSRRLSLTELEQVSNMSARNLQYVFSKRYGCSPMQWIRRERLALAREQLSHPYLDKTVSQVALDCGFTHFSAFTTAYKRQFGELPSVTMKRSLGPR